MEVFKGRTISPGKVEGEALVSKEPIGFYGGIDAKTGLFIEKGHELEGKPVKGKVLVFPCGKGSLGTIRRLSRSSTKKPRRSSPQE